MKLPFPFLVRIFHTAFCRADFSRGRETVSQVSNLETVGNHECPAARHPAKRQVGQPVSRGTRCPGRRGFGAVGLTVVTVLLAGCATAPSSGEPEPTAPAHLADRVSYRRMADGLHAVLRAANAAWIEAEAGASATPVSPSDSGLRTSDGEHGSHAAFLRRTAQEIATHGAEFSFAIRSPWPISPLGAPQTGLEEEALATLQRSPAEPLFRDEQLGGRAYFTAVYPEIATRASCINCHNQNAASARHDFAEGDFMGALVIRIPREF